MTVAPSTLVDLQNRLVRELGTINLGIVGDSSHVRTGGYHIGAKSLREAGMGGDYSLEFKIDRDATHDYACAVDIGGSPELLMKLGNRMVRALQNHDPRVHRKVRAVNAPWGGVSIDRRWDAESAATTSDDNVQANSDRGHIHLEVYRTLVTRQAVVDGIFDVFAGVVASGGHKPTGGKHRQESDEKIWQGAPVPDLIARGTGQYLGLLSGPASSHGGANDNEKRIVRKLQQRLIACGFVRGQSDPQSAWADGIFGEPTRRAVTRFQQRHMNNTTFYGRVYWDDWQKLFNL